VELGTWIERYREAWEGADPDLAASLFTEDASYRQLIFEAPNVGREGVAAYWSRVTSQQSDVAVTMGRPFADGRRATVEFWTRMTVDGSDVTLAGCLLLTFADDGRCRELREYWNLTEGRHDPPPEYGS
jgi:ketosteroid isomerase-like protein